MTTMTKALLATLLVGITACSTPSTSSPGAAGAFLGCRNVRGVAKDYTDGALNATELRARLQDVREDSETAPPAIREAANAAVRAVTAGDDAALGAAVRDMDAACKATGN